MQITPYSTFYISSGTDKENLFNNQASMVAIISFILMTLMNDSAILL